MAQKKLPMRQIQEILRLKHQNQLSMREIARSCRLPVSTVWEYLKRAKRRSHLAVARRHDEVELHQRLFGPGAQAPRTSSGGAGLGCIFTRSCAAERDPPSALGQNTTRTIPKATATAAFASSTAVGRKPSIRPCVTCMCPGRRCSSTGPARRCQSISGMARVIEASVFVAVLGFSNKTFARAFANQQLPSWIAAHCHAYAFFRGRGRVTVPDNPKTAVIKPAAMSLCSTAPTRRWLSITAPSSSRHDQRSRAINPRPKSAVQIAERQILAALRDQQVFQYRRTQSGHRARCWPNSTPSRFRRLEGSRNSWFEAQEKAKLLPLPLAPFELATWSKAKVNIDYHVVGR